MPRLIPLLFLILTISPGFAAIEIGEELAELTTQSGKVYEKVTIREILPDKVKILHAHGAATIAAEELPQHRSSFRMAARVAEREAESRAMEADENEAGESEDSDVAGAWQAQSIEDVISCCLFVKSTKAIDQQGNILDGEKRGSAFLVNHGRTTYIYSNLHNFDGVKEFVIYDSEGTEYSDIVSVEVAAKLQAKFEKANWGGDIIRLRLANYREKALSIDRTPLTQENAGERKIIITGNTRGEEVVTRLEGVIKNVDRHFIIEHTAATESGNSGSPIVDLESFKVLGILTWGMYSSESSNPAMSVWLRTPPEDREAINAGAGLATIRYERSTFEKIYEQRLLVAQLYKNARIMGLMDALIPTKLGLFVKPSQVVQGDYTVADIMAESRGHPSVRELLTLHKYLTDNNRGSLGISNQDMLKRYIGSYKSALSMLVTDRKRIERSIHNSCHYYMQCNVYSSRTISVCRAYEKALGKLIYWCEVQRGARGKPMPLTQRYRLPDFRSGIDAKDSKLD